MAGSKVGGGVNAVHLSNDKHPFGSAKGMKATSKFGKMSGVGPNPGGQGDKISANASMKKKRTVQGPGTAE